MAIRMIARKIAEVLRSLAPESRLAVIDGAGHMGPFTHGPVVSELIASQCGGSRDPSAA
jgi:hypothetical protein